MIFERERTRKIISYTSIILSLAVLIIVWVATEEILTAVRVYLVVLMGLMLELCIAEQFGEIALVKGFSYKKYCWWCFLLLPLGCLMVVALPDRGNRMKCTHEELPDL